MEQNQAQQTMIENLQQENTLIKSELCKKDNSYSFCLISK